MRSWLLEEPYVSRVVDELVIEIQNGDVEIALIKKRNNEAEEIARIDDARSVLTDEQLHCICDEFLQYCHDCEWDGEWHTLGDGTYIVDFNDNCGVLDQGVFEGHYVQELRYDDTGAVPWSISLQGLPWCLELFSYLLSRRTRERIFTPAYQDLLADYFETRQKKFHSPLARRWLSFCFAWQSVLLVIQCMRVTCLAAGLGCFFYFIPTVTKEWLREVWSHLFR